MDIDKEQLKQAVNRMIDNEDWMEAERLLDAIVMDVRNQSFIRKALDSSGNVVSYAGDSVG